MSLDRYQRQVVLDEVGATGQQRIRSGKAVIIGLGALGSASSQLLCRAGVGNLTIVDRDFVDWTNLQRQTLYTENDARQNLPKAIAARQQLNSINSDVTIEALVADVNPSNVCEIIDGATVVVDGLDNFATRALINQACVKQRIPWVHGACVATYGIVTTIVPGVTPCYECIFPGSETTASPFTCDTVGVLGPVAVAIASMQATEALKVLAGRTDAILRSLTYIDLWRNTHQSLVVERAERCAVCSENSYPLLSSGDFLATATMCGRDAIQVIPRAGMAFDFDTLHSTLSQNHRVQANQFLLRFGVGPQQIVVFRDGRAIVFGTTDKSAARSLYTRYIGG